MLRPRGRLGGIDGLADTTDLDVDLADETADADSLLADFGMGSVDVGSVDAGLADRRAWQHRRARQHRQARGTGGLVAQAGSGMGSAAQVGSGAGSASRWTWHGQRDLEARKRSR